MFWCNDMFINFNVYSDILRPLKVPVYSPFSYDSKGNIGMKQMFFVNQGCFHGLPDQNCLICFH